MFLATPSLAKPDNFQVNFLPLEKGEAHQGRGI